MNESEIVLSNKLNIMSLNIEGISMSMCDYLCKQMEEHSIIVLLLQETHVCETAPPPYIQFLAFTRCPELTMNNMEQ